MEEQADDAKESLRAVVGVVVVWSLEATSCEILIGPDEIIGTVYDHKQLQIVDESTPGWGWGGGVVEGGGAANG